MLRKIKFILILLTALLTSIPWWCFAVTTVHKDHDFIPKFRNLVFVFDVSVSMRARYASDLDVARLCVAGSALESFNVMMPPVPHWQYDVNTALVSFGDCPVPTLLSQLGPWTRDKYSPYYGLLRTEGPMSRRAATFQDALQFVGQLIGNADGKTAVVVFTDGGTGWQCPQETAVALKSYYGDRLEIFGIFFGDTEVGWRNLYEVCKLTGGYSRTWTEVRNKRLIKEFAWDIAVREIMFPYSEIFFQERSADLIPSEALKLEGVAAFLRAIPHYVLQIDGHTTFSGHPAENYRLGMQRALSVKSALVKFYNVRPERIVVRSWGEKFPRYDNEKLDTRLRNREANLYLVLNLMNYPYDEKHLHTFGTRAVGRIYNTVERNGDNEWASPVKSFRGVGLPLRGGH